MSKSRPVPPPGEAMSDVLFEVEKKHIRLLIVDDNPAFGLAIQDYSELFAFQCSIDCRLAGSEDEAAEITKSWFPNCVLLHLHLSDGDAFSLLERWRDGLMTLVAVADQHSAFIEEAARTGGADAFYTRSDNPEDLVHLIEEVIAHVPGAPAVH
jgi:DNA-binding response OmpR family regulator